MDPKTPAAKGKAANCAETPGEADDQERTSTRSKQAKKEKYSSSYTTIWHLPVT